MGQSMLSAKPRYHVKTGPWTLDEWVVGVLCCTITGTSVK